MDDDASSTKVPVGQENVEANVGQEIEDDGSWVLVEKQRITILVSPPSPMHKDKRSIAKASQMKSRRKTYKKRLSGPCKIGHAIAGKRMSALKPSDPAAQIDDGTTKTLPAHQVPHLPDLCGESLPSQSFKIMDTPNHIVGKCLRDKPGLPGTAVCYPRPPVGALDVVNLRLQAKNLERKLTRLGGLRRWLVSLGLPQFVTMLEMEKVDKFQLVRLTMGKLKEMGADAVGPRRKLIHAIDQLSQPYFAKTL